MCKSFWGPGGRGGGSDVGGVPQGGGEGDLGFLVMESRQERMAR